ncbi:sulfite oxidase-like oxidoreductase [Rhizobacter sp. OV335]|uniref:sulfite oxidase-like oxidoreductase n=1 Tax=Rhizobacter sp. OV335 TaxID=1500264 RepID=UPI0009167AB7|nr:sulfite oxidase-like oxidoreductase [Rhizobacter sp. OV335]SHN28926.1 Oxidoreductase molybdopterin binding domain-containing protein [Rhizobacter sp. OV335]
MATRGFFGRRPATDVVKRLPPGQHLTDDFPVLSYGPTPEVPLADWRFTLHHGPRPLASWSWDEFNALPQTTWRGDIHCVTTWSKFDTEWQGVTIDDLLRAAGLEAPTPYVLARSFDDYDTNVPLADLVNGQAMVATRFGGAPLAPEHGGPARLLVPHLYFWKSAKWLKGLRFTARDEAGFWELRGYHLRGDPWREQRYTNDP